MSKTILALLYLAGTVWAQDSATFRVDTRLVEVDVVVRHGDEPVAGLKVDDFAVFDRGRKQRIATFFVLRDVDEHTPRPLAPGEFSNRIVRTSPGGETPAPTIILLDTLNSNADNMLEARRQLLRYLDRSPPGEVFALYSLNKTLNRLHDFTGDRAHLRDIVNRWIASASVDMMAEDLMADVVASIPFSADAITSGTVAASAAEMTDMANLNRATTTAFAMEMIAKHMSGLPGRKKLIWIGGGFPARTSEIRRRIGSRQIETRDYAIYIEKAARALNEARVAVYPIDSRPPCTPTCTADPMFMRPGIDTMNLFASATGGRAFYMVSDMAGAIEKSVQDSEVTYRLGFYPDSSALDGKYHDLKVQVARGGVEVRYRRGYLAANRKALSPADRLVLLKSAMESPLDATEIGLSAQFLSNQSVPEFLLKIDTRELQLTTEQTANGRTVWTALIAVGMFFPNQPERPATINGLKLTFTEDRLREVLTDGYMMRLQVNDGAIHGKMRVSVQDRSTGRTGSVTLDVR